MRKRAIVPLLLLLLLVVVGGAVWQVSTPQRTPTPPVSDARGPPPAAPSRPPAAVPLVDADAEPGDPADPADPDAPGWVWEAPGVTVAAALPPPGDGATLSVIEPTLPSTLHPLHARTDVDRRYQDLVYDRLFRPDAAGVLGSDLVARALILPRSVRVTLRPGIRFHGRDAVSARDVCQTVRILLDPTVPSTVGGRYRALLRGCDANADGTATVHLRAGLEGDPRAHLDFAILPAGLTRADLAADAAPPPGTGPMRRSGSAGGLSFTAVDNPHRRAAIGRITVSASADPSAAVGSLRTGGAQVAVGVRGVEVPDGVTLVPAANPEQALVLVLDPTDSPWSELRDALDQAIDRSALAEAAGRAGFVRPGWPAIGLLPTRPDPAAARRKLAGRALRLGSPVAERPVADALAASLRAVGVQVSVLEVPADGAEVEGADAWLATWSAPAPSAPSVVLWSEDAAVAVTDRVRVPQLLRLDALFSPIEDWRILP